jgi:site-specific DNA-methyltransferase (adenine-specific)
MRSDLEFEKQWKTERDYLDWIGSICDEFKRVLAPNGSLYLCASPQMSYAVEGQVRERFNVLNSIRWLKSDGTFSRADVTTYRSWLPAWEAVIFAEQQGAGDDGLFGHNYASGVLHSEIMQPVREYLDGERVRCGLSIKDIDEATQTAMASHWFTHPSQWVLPTEQRYAELRAIFNGNGRSGFLPREYETLREQYETLREQYETLRRTFNNRPGFFRDDWHYAQVEANESKHPTEKPLPMLLDIVETSSRPMDLVVDPFLGRGATAVACQKLGRRFVGGDYDEHWCASSRARLLEARGKMHTRVKRPVEPKPTPKGQKTMFDFLED